MRLIPATGEETRTSTEAQRARLLGATVHSVAELGYAKLSVADVVARAGASRETFYQIFANREEAFLEALNDTVARAGARAGAAAAEQQTWEGRLRAGLETVLRTLEEEPALARVLAESQRGGPRVLKRRTEILDELARIVDGGRELARDDGPPPLTAHSLVAGAVSVVHERLLTPAAGSLTELVGPLMSMIVFPYRGPAAATAELERPVKRRRRKARAQRRPAPLEGIESRLTYLMMRVLGFVAEHPGASNREVGDGVGIVDGGQISKLLARLSSLGLIENAAQGSGRGVPNAWRIAPRGDQIRHTLQL
ncbi:MAG TPA: TetR/AcrR family transcriptional regulator [Solirubrobacteraceae bacterium]|nr:TetR/AcrR family transcriptional regulator [Solirubrobacteraceae bacterium]